MVAFNAVKAGDTLYTVARQKMGNTTIRRTVCHSVKVIEVHDDHVIASWNGNPARRYSAYNVKQWRRTPLKPRS